MTLIGESVVLVNVSLIPFVPVAAALLIPVTAARLHANVVPEIALVGVYVNAFPVVTAAARLLDNTGTALGAAAALAALLLHPLTVLVTV